MREEVFAAVIRRDEAETLRVVEPLYGTCRHVDSNLFLCEADRASLAGMMFKGRIDLLLGAAWEAA
jgi:hypothetical protein